MPGWGKRVVPPAIRPGRACSPCYRRIRSNFCSDSPMMVKAFQKRRIIIFINITFPSLILWCFRVFSVFSLLLQSGTGVDAGLADQGKGLDKVVHQILHDKVLLSTSFGVKTRPIGYIGSGFLTADRRYSGWPHRSGGRPSPGSSSDSSWKNSPFLLIWSQSPLHGAYKVPVFLFPGVVSSIHAIFKRWSAGMDRIHCHWAHLLTFFRRMGNTNLHPPLACFLLACQPIWMGFPAPTHRSEPLSDRWGGFYPVFMNYV